METGAQKLQTTCLLLLTAAVVAAALYFLSGVLVPFVLALFLAIGLWPAIDLQIRRLRLPRGVAVLTTMVLGAGLLFLVGLLVASSVDQMLANQASYTAKLDELLERGEQALVRLGILEEQPGSSDAPAGPGGQRLGDMMQGEIGKVLGQTLSGLLGVMSQGLVVLIFLLFLLMGRDPGEDHPTGYWAEVERGVRRYLQVKVAVSALTGTVVGVVLTVLGVDLALVFAVFAFLLNFVPNVGSIIASLLPLPVVLVSDLSTLAAVLAIALPAAAQFLIGNALEPRWMGRSLDLHPVVVLLALIFWGTLWGIIGVILAVPVTAALKILLEKAEATAPVARWMAGGLGG